MIVLDAGHGDDTVGKSWDGFDEWRFNRDVQKFLTLEYKHRKIPYHILVPEDDDIGLRTRVERAKEVEADLLISIHGNAFPKDTSVRGLETFYYSKEGRVAANIFQTHLLLRLGWPDRGTKKANYYIIKKSPQVSILPELGFYTNDTERAMMSDQDYQVRMAVALADATEEYLHICKKK